VWILAALAAVLLLVIGGVLLLLGGGGEDGTPTAVPTQVIVVVTSTPGGMEVLPSPTPSVPTMTTEVPTGESTTAPSDTSLPPTDMLPAEPTAAPTDTPPLPTETPVPPTQTPIPPTKAPPPTPTTPSCAVQAQGLFAGLWQTYWDRLGCPLYAQPRIIQDAEQAFENGHMFWRQDTDYAYVVYRQGGRAGTFQPFKDMWAEGQPEYSCQASPPPGRIQPKRGFGAVWCYLGGPSAPIGWGLSVEVGFGPGYGDPLAQDFEQGIIFSDSDGRNKRQAYVMFLSEGTFLQAGY
jgi:hypothetical protein